MILVVTKIYLHQLKKKPHGIPLLSVEGKHGKSAGINIYNFITFCTHVIVRGIGGGGSYGIHSKVIMRHSISPSDTRGLCQTSKDFFA